MMYVCTHACMPLGGVGTPLNTHSIRKQVFRSIFPDSRALYFLTTRSMSTEFGGPNYALFSHVKIDQTRQGLRFSISQNSGTYDVRISPSLQESETRCRQVCRAIYEVRTFAVYSRTSVQHRIATIARKRTLRKSEGDQQENRKTGEPLR